METIKLGDLTYSVDKKTLERYERKLDSLLKRKKAEEFTSIAIAGLFAIGGLVMLLFQVFTWLRTGVWTSYPWYITIFSSDLHTFSWSLFNNIFQFILFIDLWLVLILLCCVLRY